MIVRLLLDENLSEALLPKLPAAFGDSAHVRTLLGEGHPDRTVWNRARDGGFILLTARVTAPAHVRSMGRRETISARAIGLRRPT